VTQRLLDTFARSEKLVRYFDIPLQHASRNVLARMKRGSHGGAFLKLIERIRRSIPGVWLRTTFIVGFPGETETDFRELCDFVRAAEFDWMGVFGYSDEETARSYALDGKVDSETISRRREELMGIQRKITARRLKTLLGSEITVLIDGPSRDTEWLWEGRLAGMAPEIDGKVYLTEFPEGSEPQPGQFARARITQSTEYDLVGRVIEFLDDGRAAPELVMPGGVLRVLG
jgi:ribosomal protein S12 methylthiotransferase